MGKLSKRLTSLVTTVILTTTIICGDIRISPQVKVKGATTYTNEYGLAKKTEDGVILHAFTWRFTTIKNKMKEIAESGFSAVQVSPVQKCSTSPGQNVWEWVFTYRPTGYSIGNHIVGTEEEFKAMCKEADKYGIKIIVDVVANHLIRDNETDPALRDNNEYYHNAGVINGGDYNNNRWKVTHGDLAIDLPDLNTGHKDVQKKVIEFLNNCIDDGADGFRFDMAKHIELPNDQGGSDFWPTILDAIYKKKSDAFVYGEVLQDATSNYGEYNKIMFTGADAYSRNLRDKVISNNNTENVNGILDYSCDGGNPSKLVTYIETHDHFANDTGGSPNIYGGTRGFNNWQMEKGYTIVASRQKGTPLFFDRPAFTGMVDRTAKWPGTYGLAGPMGVSQNMWKDAEVIATNKFHNAMIGEQEHIESINNNTVLIKRGNKGVAIVNMDGGADVNVKVGLPDGKYKDLGTSGGTFEVSGGMLKGKVQSGKTAFIYKEEAIVKIPTPTISMEGGSFIDSLELTLGYTNATSGTYSIDDGSNVTYSNGEKIKIGENNKIGDKIKVTLTATDGVKTSDPVTYVFRKKDPNERNDLKSPQLENSKIKITVNASGGVGNLLYKFDINDKEVQGYSSKNTYTWNPKTKGDYKIKVIVKDEDGNKNYKYITYTIKEKNSSLSVDSFSVNPKSVRVGETVKLSANASGGSGTIQYKFVAKKGNNETIIKNYSTTKTVTWTPSVAGEYELLVYAKDSEGNSDYATTSCTVEESSEEVVITTDKASPQVTGTAIKITAKTKNISNPKYMISIFSYSDGWTTVKKYSTSNEYVWTPKKSGKYKIEVAVMDAKGKEIFKRLNYEVAEKVKRIEENNSNIKYIGKWSTSRNKNHSDGAVKISNTTGSSAEFKFTGTGIKLLASTYKDRGIAKVTIDGVSYSVDMYSAKAIYKNVVFQKKGLKSGTHTIKVEYTGMRDSKSTGNLIIDAFDIVEGNII